MRAYWAVFSARFRMLLQYRVAALAGCVTQVFWGLIRLMILWAFYLSSTARQPMSYDQVVSYIWLGQAMIMLILFRPDTEIDAMIRSGTVAYELVRPVDLYRLWFCRGVAGVVAPMMLRMVPILIIAALCFGLGAPASLAAGTLWLLSAGAAVLLSAAVSTLMSISLLWTVSGLGATRLLSASFYFFSGMVVPLPLFPDWAQPIIRVLPFRALADTPFRIYSGHIPPAEALAAIGHQFAWVVGFALLGQWLLSRGTRRLVVQGG